MLDIRTPRGGLIAAAVVIQTPGCDMPMSADGLPPGRAPSIEPAQETDLPEAADAIAGVGQLLRGGTFPDDRCFGQATALATRTREQTPLAIAPKPSS